VIAIPVLAQMALSELLKKIISGLWIIEMLMARSPRCVATEFGLWLVTYKSAITNQVASMQLTPALAESF
jgi:hypothetical protein